MFKKVYLTLATVLVSLIGLAQTGTLKGVVKDAISGEPIPFANVIAERNGNQNK